MAENQGAAVVGRYQRYKAGTRKVVNWLAKTAAKDCKLDDVLAGHRKRKPTPKCAFTIRVKSHELVALVKIIAANQQATVPAGILKILQDVIDGRQSAADWYAHKATEGDVKIADQNGRHVHFTGILQTIQQFLDGLEVTPGSELAPMSSAKKSKKKKKKNDTGKAVKSVDEIRNLFEYLEVEEPSAAPLGLLGPSNTGVNEETPNYELDGEEETDVFALWCHLKDMSDVRVFVRGVWIEYCRGDVTIEVAGTVADAALALLARAHEAFASTHHTFNDWADIMNFLNLQVGFNNNAVCVFPRGENALAAHFAPDTKPTDLLCPSASMKLGALQECLLQYYQDAVQSGFVQGGPQSKGLNAPTKVTASDPPDPLSSFSIPLLSIIPQITRTRKLNESGLGKTAFTKGLLPLIGEPGMVQPMSTIFAVQICMDINELVGHLSCGLDSIQRTALHVTQTIDDISQLYNSRPFLNDAKQEFVKIRDLATTIRQEAVEHAQILEKPQPKASETDAESIERQRAESLPSALYALLHCEGVESYTMKLRLFEECTVLANQNLVMILLAHFYSAARRYGLVTAVWHDLDFLVTQHSTRRPFITKTHSHTVDKYGALKNFVADLEGPASGITHFTIPPLPSFTVPTKFKRIDAEDATIVNALRQRDWKHADKCLSRGEVLDALLSSIATKTHHGTPAQKRQQFTPTQLLTTLKVSLINDEKLLNFSYFEFTELCLKLLSKLVAVFVASNKSCEYHFQAVYHMLKGAADADVQGRPVSGTTFGRAAAVLQSELQSMETNKYARAALHASSGHIPKSQCPNRNDKADGAEPELEELLQKYPDISVGISRDTFEFYDPAGSFEKFSGMLQDGLIKKFMPKGSKGPMFGIVDSEGWKDAHGDEEGFAVFQHGEGANGGVA